MTVLEPKIALASQRMYGLIRLLTNGQDLLLSDES